MFPYNKMPFFATTEFPLELQLSILEHLSPSDLLHAARASKNLRAAVENILYSNITLEWNHEREPSFSALLRTLFARPELSRHIKSLYLKGSTIDRDGYITWRPKLPSLSVAGIPFDQTHSFIDSIGLATVLQETWKSKLRQGNVHAIATMLICLAPNLSSLRLDPLFTIETEILGHVLRHALFGHPGTDEEVSWRPLLRLRELCIANRHDESRRTDLNNAADLLPLFYLPALESLMLSLDNPTEFAWPTTSPPKAARLSSLELWRVRETRLAPILAAAPDLKSFKWTCFYVRKLDEGVSTRTIDIDIIMLALAPLRNSVENLAIEATCFLGGTEIEFPSLHISGSLAGLDQFHFIRWLQIPWVFIMGFSPSQNRRLLADLPPSLEELTVTDNLCADKQWNWDAKGRYSDYTIDDNDDPCARTAAILDAVEGLNRAMLPSLANITLAWYLEDDEHSEDQLSRFSKACARLQLRVSWKEDTITSGTHGPLYPIY